MLGDPRCCHWPPLRSGSPAEDSFAANPVDCIWGAQGQFREIRNGRFARVHNCDWTIHSEFSHWTWRFSIAMLVYQRVTIINCDSTSKRGTSQGKGCDFWGILEMAEREKNRWCPSPISLGEDAPVNKAVGPLWVMALVDLPAASASSLSCCFGTTSFSRSKEKNVKRGIGWGFQISETPDLPSGNQPNGWKIPLNGGFGPSPSFLWSMASSSTRNGGFDRKYRNI